MKIAANERESRALRPVDKLIDELDREEDRDGGQQRAWPATSGHGVHSKGLPTSQPTGVPLTVFVQTPHVDRPMVSTRIAEMKPAYNYKAEQAIWFVVGVVDALLIIRFLLKLLGASLASGFVRFMYDLTARPFMPLQHGRIGPLRPRT